MPDYCVRPATCESRSVVNRRNAAARRRSPATLVVALLAAFATSTTAAPSAFAAEEPADAGRYVNRLSRLSARHLEHYVPFYFAVPKGWVAEPKAGTEESSNVVQYERRRAEGDTVVKQESFAVGELTGVGTGPVSQDLMAILCESMSGNLAAGFPNYKKSPDAELTFAGLQGHGFDFSFEKDPDPKSFRGWGRVVLIPGPAFGGSGGLAIVLFATSAAPEIASAADLGVKGELPAIIGSFKTGRPQESAEETAAEVKRLLERADAYLSERTYPAENASRAGLVIAEAVRLAPRDPRLLVFQAHVARRQGKHDECLALLNSAVELAPADVETRLARARERLSRAENKEAKADIDEALRLAPQSADANAAADAQAALGAWHSDFNVRNFDAALAAYDEAIRLDPKRAEFYFARARVRADQSAYASNPPDDLILADYDAAIRLDPKMEAARANRADLHERLDRAKEALADVDALTKLDPQNRRYRERLAVLLVRAGEFDRAITELDEILKFANPTEIDSAYAHLYLARGDAHYGKKDLERASPDYQAAMNSARFTYLRFERPELLMTADEAKARLEEADAQVKNAPTDPNLRVFRAMLRYLGRDFAGAVEDFDATLKGDSLKFYPVSLRGFAKLHLFRDDDARDDFDAALKLFETDKEIQPFTNVGDFEAFVREATADIKQRRGKPPEKK
jgi:tetratricopeptide (TPR) repeat protein